MKASSKEARTSITGRDGFIMQAALVYAIGTIQSLPRQRQAVSDMCDMCTILRAHGQSFLIETLVREVEGKLGCKIDIDADLKMEAA